MYFTSKQIKFYVIPCTSFFQRVKGLMFLKKPITNVYYFPHCHAIHTFFMRQKIDLCMLDKNYQIVFLRANVSKNHIFYQKGAKHTLEMPLGSVKKLKKGEILFLHK